MNVYRRALAAQPDGGIVIASTGYLGNLADLLKSPPDSISPGAATRVSHVNHGCPS